jgi:hypothetical protein
VPSPKAEPIKLWLAKVDYLVDWWPATKSDSERVGFETAGNERKIGGAERDRTVGLLNAIQALSQLSYSPTFSCPSYAEAFLTRRRVTFFLPPARFFAGR